MRVVRTIADLRALLRPLRGEGKRIGFVPTMGFLHEGHGALIRQSAARCDATVVSIFVNPTQFGPSEDLASYPRDLERDQNLCLEAGATVLFLPDDSEIYPTGFQTHVEPGRLSDSLCGRFRPGHFRGVTTVVVKLFNMVQPDLAVFGEKDFQQLLVIRRMTEDLCLPVSILGVPTVRESDGLAMSSRNGYLSPEERAIAPAVERCLQEAATALRAGGAAEAVERATVLGLDQAGLRPDYVAVRRALDLGEVGPTDRELVILAAAWLGPARLIDNLRVTRPN